MKDQSNYLGMLLRNERLNRELELGDVAEGICAPSYLCKIELGQARPSQALLRDLLDRLELSYELDERFLEEMGAAIDRVYEGVFYHDDLKQDLRLLGENEDRIRMSPLRLSYDVLTDYLDQRISDEREPLVIYMDDRELAFYLLSRIDFEHQPDLDQARRADDLLGNSFSRLTYLQACLQNNRFEAVKSLGDDCLVLAQKEGNLYTLIQANILIATSYASESHLAVAIDYYERAARLIRSSLWPGMVSDINYNLGATYLELGDLEKASAYLLKVPRSYGFYLFHKLAWLALATSERAAARRELAEMKKTINKDRTRSLIYEATAMQLEDDFASSADSLRIVEALISCLLETKHIGFLRFHRVLITTVFKTQRKYKQAYEYERMLGDYTRGVGR